MTWLPPVDLPPGARPFLVDDRGGALLTFAQLRTAAERLCRDLEARGAGPGRAVAARLLNGPDFVIGLAATWLAGAAFVPLSPGLTEAEAARVLELARPAVQLGPGGACPAPGPPDGDSGLQPGDALVLFTSGSTGVPKGVVLTAANVRAGALAVRDRLALTADDRTVALLPWTHGHGLLGVALASLQAGASIIVSEQRVATLAIAAPAARDATWLSLVPPLLSSLLGSPARLGLRRLRLVRTASAPLPPQLALRAEETWACPVAEAYGMTETSHQAAANAPDLATRRLGTVGLPTGVRFRLGAAAGDGSLLEVEGPSVFRGYLRRPDLTAEALDGGRWYRTGDVGAIEPSGHVRLLGRISELINRGGFKVSPVEVEEAINAHPSVSGSLVAGVPHAVLGEEVAALVVLRAGQTLRAGDVGRHCATLLADYKRPGIVRFVAEIPCLPNGKPSRRLARDLLTG